MIPKISTITQVVPSLTNSVIVTPGTGVYSAWSQIIASIGYDFVLCGSWTGLAFATTATGNTFARWQVQVGTGAAGSEVVIAEFADYMWINKNAGVEQALIGHLVTHFVSPKLIPSGSSIAVRAWGATGGTRAVPALFGYKLTAWDQVKAYSSQKRYLQGLSTSNTTLYPNSGVTNVIGGTPQFTYGSWTQLIASTTAPTLIKAVTLGVDSTPTSVNTECELQLGIGAAGSEVVVDNIRSPVVLGNGQAAGGVCYLQRPLYLPTGTRLAGRVATRPASEGFDVIVIGEILK